MTATLLYLNTSRVMTAASRSTTYAIPGTRCTRTASCATAVATLAASAASSPPGTP